MKRALLLSTASGILYAAAQPPLGFSLLAFVALVPLLAATGTRSAGSRLLLGAIAGTVAGAGCVGTSVYAAARLYFEQPPWSSALVALLVPLVYGAPFFAAFALLAGSGRRDDGRSLRPLLVVPAAWVVSEFARANVIHGTPWCMLAHSQAEVPTLQQTAALGGAFAVSFVIALVNVGALAGVRAIVGALAPSLAVRRIGVAALVLVAALVYGRRDIALWSKPAGEPLRVAIVQPNIPPEWRGSLARVPAIVDRLSALTRATADDAPRLVVWPENAVGFVIDVNDLPLRAVGEAIGADALLLLGAPRGFIGEDGRQEFRNAAFLADRSGHVLGSQDKRRLTPFAEYWPRGLPRPLGRNDAYTPGSEVALLDADGVRIGVLICSEAIYPDLARDLVAAGAELIAVLSNDAWFGASVAPTHHLNAVRLRAVELRRYLVRSTNTGLSVVVAPSGEIIARVPPAEQGTAVADVVPLTATTPYARFGDLLVWLCAAVVGVDVLWRRGRSA